MLRTLFARLFALMLAAVLICVITLFSLFYVSARSATIDARMAELKVQAYDIAYLAGRVQNYGIMSALGYGDSTQEFIQWKANEIYRRFNAYCVVVDRTGGATLYAKPDMLREDQLFFDQNKTISILTRVLGGEEIVYRTEGTEPMFTVAVPWTSRGTVLGAVLIQTAEQTVYASTRGLAVRVSLLSLAVLLVSGLAMFFITRQIVRPLKEMAYLAGEIARGDFSRRVPVSGSSETRKLAQSFNTMAGQLEALEQTRRDFVANVSHELRSPMTSMQGFLQGMLDGTIPLSQQRQYMQIVLDETRRLGKLIANLLNLSRMENSTAALSVSDFDIHERIRRVIIASMTQLDEKRLEVSLSFADAPCFVRADADQIEQVLINLVSNAIKYTPEGGHIDIATQTGDHLVRIRVSDDGPGIAPEDAPYIFDRFYKADKAHTVGKGTGLGLAICKRIMELHGQSIRLVQSTSGAAFEITLPLSDWRED